MTMGIDAVNGVPSATTRREADRLLVVDLQSRRGPELYGLARRLGLSADEADDAVQESLLRAWLALDGGRPIAQLDAWCFRVLYRICMDQHRWRRRVQRLADRMHPRADAGGPAAAAERLALWDAVDRLPARQRAVVYLRYRADLSFDQIGDVLGIRAVSARSHASRALDRLGTLLSMEDFR
jgi:RNA polymerase sigma factor (sigma-70 family)